MIFVLGSVNMDLVVFSDKFPEVGETIVGTRFIMNQGGKGANQAVAAKLAGGEVTFIGRVGADFFGDVLIQELKSKKLNLQFVKDERTSTGTALINVSETGENKIVIIKGTNQLVSVDDVGIFSNLSSPGDILLLQGEIPIETTVEALKVAREKKVFSIFDPAPFSSSMKEFVNLPDLITPNKVELQQLTNVPHYLEGVEILKEMGAKKILVKLGNKGCYYVDENNSFHFPAFKVDALDSTAAGDVFNGTLAVALSERYSFNKAITFACAAAAISVTRPGASQSAPEKQEILDFLKERNEEDYY